MRFRGCRKTTPSFSEKEAGSRLAPAIALVVRPLCLYPLRSCCGSILQRIDLYGATHAS